MTRKLKDKFNHKPKIDLDWHAGVVAGVIGFICIFIYSLLIQKVIHDYWGEILWQAGGGALICIAVAEAVRWYEKRKHIN